MLAESFFRRWRRPPLLLIDVSHSPTKEILSETLQDQEERICVRMYHETECHLEGKGMFLATPLWFVRILLLPRTYLLRDHGANGDSNNIDESMLFVPIQTEVMDNGKMFKN